MQKTRAKDAFKRKGNLKLAFCQFIVLTIAMHTTLYNTTLYITLALKMCFLNIVGKM